MYSIEYYYTEYLCQQVYLYIHHSTLSNTVTHAMPNTTKQPNTISDNTNRIPRHNGIYNRRKHSHITYRY